MKIVFRNLQSLLFTLNEISLKKENINIHSTFHSFHILNGYSKSMHFNHSVYDLKVTCAKET